MPFKILKDAGVVPPEVDLLRQRAALRAELAACTDAAQAAPLRQRLTALELSLSLRLESLGRAR